jgi:REP element-mobilizing transposase RayT
MAIRTVCQQKQWDLIALHVRRTHVHSVVSGEASPKRIRAAMKYRASRLLNKIDSEPRKRWTDGGSGRYLWTPEAVAAAVDYVLLRQGNPMETYEKEGWVFQFS